MKSYNAHSLALLPCVVVGPYAINISVIIQRFFQFIILIFAYITCILISWAVFVHGLRNLVQTAGNQVLA